MPTPGPRYTDDQMALILKRAAELQSAGEDQTHTLAEIQQIAQQVGIEPRLIAAAAAGLPAQTQGRATDGVLFGASSSYRHTLRLPGSPPAARRAELIATIRDHMAQVGAVREFEDASNGTRDRRTTRRPSRSSRRRARPSFAWTCGSTAPRLACFCWRGR
jgi:hypothetical protein